jgi:glycopeptide antibiotics resistance protein
MFRLSDLLILFPLALAARIIWGALRPTARAPIGRVILDAVFVCYLVALAEVVLGFRHLGGLGADFLPLAHVNLVPLRTISEVARPGLAAKALGQVVGNVLLFVPLGVLLPLTAARFRTFRSVFVAGLLLSVSIEGIQLGLLLGRLMNRAADIDDVILNTIGAALGYAIWALLFRGASHQAEKARSAIEGES